MSTNFSNLATVIPLIVLSVTLLFNLLKEKRDRDYEFRPIPSVLAFTDLSTVHSKDNINIMYNDKVLKIDEQDLGHFLKITNISKSPMLSVLVDVKYKKIYRLKNIKF